MKKIILITVIGASILLAACGGQQSAPVEPPVEPPAAPDAMVEESAELPLEPAVQGDPASQPQSAGAMSDYAAPEDLFQLQVPSGWSMQKDTQTIENTVVETFTAPDGNAFVQVLANKVNYSLDHILKGQVTLDYMKRLYGADMRVASDVALPDGRERLEWWSEENKTSGTTYFDMGKRYLYFYTVAYNDKFEDDYASVLKEVANSFSQ